MADVYLFLKQKYESAKGQIQEVLRTEELYNGITVPQLKFLFAAMHQRFNSLYSFMFSKQRGNGHYNANESRELLYWIKLYEDMEYMLRSSPFSFTMNEDYVAMAKFCKGFLRESNGCDIPDDLPELFIIEYDPIFTLHQVTEVPNVNQSSSYQLKLIGAGSYAQVLKYKDEYYNRFFCVKRALKELTPKELERFRREYDVMHSLASPYILEVFRFDDAKNEYIMEYADETLKSYIDKHNSSLPLSKRKSIAKQIFRGLDHIHSKELLHRDLSVTNILLKHYDDGITIVKISDFGLVKEKNSDLTSFGSEIKGSFNDSNLQVVGFSNYSIEYETFALTRLILYVMTGKYNLEKVDEKIRGFVIKGIHADITQRYHSIGEIEAAFDLTWN